MTRFFGHSCDTLPDAVGVPGFFHAAADTGARGDPASTTGTAKARVSYFAGYYDAADRMTASVNVGTNGGAAYTRPGTVPARSDTVLVNSYVYNTAGALSVATDPKAIETSRPPRPNRRPRRGSRGSRNRRAAASGRRAPLRFVRPATPPGDALTRSFSAARPAAAREGSSWPPRSRRRSFRAAASAGPDRSRFIACTRLAAR